MKIIKRTNLGDLVLYAGKNLTLTGQLIAGAGWSYLAPPSWELVLEEAVLPDGYYPSGWTYTGGVWTINATGSTEVLPGKKANKIESLTASATEANYADITQDSIVWKADLESRRLLAEVLSVGSVPVTMYWRDTNGVSHDRTYAQLQAIGYAILERGLTIDTTLTSKVAEVNAALTTAAIEAITWE